MKLIFGQGNPEPTYTSTRHNVGFMVLDAIANENNIIWGNKPKLNAKITEIKIGNEKILLAKPTTFYNETGTSIKKIINFYKLDPINDLLVIHDDLALPFGTIRIRNKGSSAGNNGIKSINAAIKQFYPRIKIGIRNDKCDQMEDADFVLAKFSKVELKQLKKSIIPQVVELITEFCTDLLEHTSYKIS
jgi:PTH1 family peptidyl-tRNA hydrolase